MTFTLRWHHENERRALRAHPAPRFSLASFSLCPICFSSQRPAPAPEERGSLLSLSPHLSPQNIDTLERVAGLEPEDLVEAHGTFYTSHCISPLCRREYPLSWMKGEALEVIHEGGCPPASRRLSGAKIRGSMLWAPVVSLLCGPLRSEAAAGSAAGSQHHLTAGLLGEQGPDPIQPHAEMCVGREVAGQPCSLFCGV